MHKDLHYLYVITIGILIFFGGLIASMHQEKVETNKALSEAVKFALDKGIEPLAVTCAYEMDKEPSPLCIMYVNKVQFSHDISVDVIKK